MALCFYIQHFWVLELIRNALTWGRHILAFEPQCFKDVLDIFWPSERHTKRLKEQHPATLTHYPHPCLKSKKLYPFCGPLSSSVGVECFLYRPSVFFPSLAPTRVSALRLQAAIDWSHWGEAVSSDLRPMLPLAPQFSALLNGAGAHVAEPSSDVVLQARQQWAESCGQCLHYTQREKPTVNPIKLGQPLGGLGEGRTRRVQREEPEIDPVSGLEVWQTQSLTIELCITVQLE